MSVWNHFPWNCIQWDEFRGEEEQCDYVEREQHTQPKRSNQVLKLLNFSTFAVCAQCDRYRHCDETIRDEARRDLTRRYVSFHCCRWRLSFSLCPDTVTHTHTHSHCEQCYGACDPSLPHSDCLNIVFRLRPTYQMPVVHYICKLHSYLISVKCLVIPRTTETFFVFRGGLVCFVLFHHWRLISH